MDWADNTPTNSVDTKPSQTLSNLRQNKFKFGLKTPIGEKSKSVGSDSPISVDTNPSQTFPNTQWKALKFGLKTQSGEKSKSVGALIHPLVSIQTHRKLFTSVSKIRPNSTTKGFKERANLMIKENYLFPGFCSWSCS